MKITILPSARGDLAAGFAFYESQEEGLGNYFLESLLSDIDSLHFRAGSHLSVFGFHRLLSKRFPYAIYYSLDSDTASIQAVLDCCRNPSWTIRKRQRPPFRLNATASLSQDLRSVKPESRQWFVSSNFFLNPKFLQCTFLV